jgi:glutathione S-transferase P
MLGLLLTLLSVSTVLERIPSAFSLSEVGDETSNMPSLGVLQYFACRGRVQALRYLAADNDFELEEDFFPYGGSEWPALKPQTPFGQVPVLHDGDFHLAQSNAILRYVSRKYGFYGNNDKEAALIDMINDQQEDVRLTYYYFIYNDYDKPTGREDYIKSLPTHLAPFEKFLGENNGGTGFFVGDKISFADYNIFDLLDIFEVLSPNILDGFPKLKGFYSRIASRDKIAKHRSTDAFTKLPFCGNGKQ